MANTLYYGDNLTVLRESIRDESVDLIYLDPPFNSNANYNVLFRNPTGEQSKAQIEAFEDSWHWNDAAEFAVTRLSKRRAKTPRSRASWRLGKWPPDRLGHTRI